MSLRFLRYARPAVAAAISQRAGDPQARIRATVVPELQMRTDPENGASVVWPALTPGARLSVLGPADVVALASDQMLARVPAPDANGVSPSQFAWVEFARADLPWLFTPYAPNADDTLMPWLCLVVVPATAAELAQGAHGTVLRLNAAASAHLPDLARAAEWAHVQQGDARIGDDRDTVGEGLRQEPRRFRSRLLCPTVLQPDTDYLACLVPTLLGGRKAGLSEDIDLNRPELLGPAWTAGQAVELPVYDHWRFATGASDRFSDLAMELERYDPSGTAARTLEAGAPDGPGGPQFANARLTLDAAMRPSVVPPTPPPSPPPAALTAHLTTRLSDASPLAPPTYGGRHVRAALPFAPQAPAWVRTLNLDPVRRAAAGLGAEVVRRHQEEMMAAIWEQAGEIERANQLLRIGQTARAAATALFQRRVLPDLQSARDGQHLGALLWLSPMLGHLPVPPGGLTVRTELERSCLPRLATSGAYRKFARPNGPPMRRLRRHRDGASSASELLLRLADGGGRRVPPPAPAATTITYDELTALGQLPSRPIGPGLPSPIDPLLSGPPWRTPPAEPESLTYARSLAGYLALPRGGSCRPFGAAGGSERETLFEGLRAAADPAMTIPRRTRARIGTGMATLARIGPTDDALDPLMLAPKLPWAMSRPLMAMARDWMAPALESRGAPENYIAVLEPNPAFIESYMTGLNEEIGREMLWRGFPTDQRGTVFDRFWTETRREWPDLHTWNATLGDHGLPGTVPKMVIAVRGRLLQRFDRARVFLQKASTATPPAPLPDLGSAQSTLYPLIETRLPGGVACFGFDLTTAQAIGGAGVGPGWYLVFQEPPTDLRFGPPATAAAGTHVAGSATSATADTFAENARRQQQRVYIHAATLLGPT
jgi:hypothetical protein